MTIELRDVTRKNWRECIALTVAPGQEQFVAPNVRSLAESKFYPRDVPLAIYDGDQMIGFTMIGQEEEEAAAGQWWIIRFMIDAKQQGKGYGKAALREVLKLLQTRPDCKEIFLSVEPHNTVARHLYHAFGFVDTGLIESGEMVMRYTGPTLV